jgi:hypothetical protein
MPTNSLTECARDAARAIANHPGYLLATSALAGFVVGSVVKRLLSSKAGGNHEGCAASNQRHRAALHA